MKNNTDKNAQKRRNLDILPTFFFSLLCHHRKNIGDSTSKKYPALHKHWLVEVDVVPVVEVFARHDVHALRVVDAFVDT